MATMDEPFPPAPFEGFAPAAFNFFRDLADHQDKDWFNAHKLIYENSVKAPMQSLVMEVSQQLAKARLPIKGDPQKALFRINRDIRFAKDKRPYKTHVGAVLTRSGAKDTPGLLYIHFDPKGCFAAAGFFRAEPSTLQALRRGLVRNPAGWTKVLRALDKAKLEIADDNALTRVPKGFEDVPPAVAEALKLKSWIVRRPLSKATMSSAKAANEIAAFAADAYPLLQFGWAALDG
jgi:uncharacterized protein (TIGR02453 family)